MIIKGCNFGNLLVNFRYCIFDIFVWWMDLVVNIERMVEIEYNFGKEVI